MTVNEDLLESYLEVRGPISRIYEPQEVSVVMGAGRKNRDDLIHTNIHEDGVPVLMRKGGGGTVVLSPGMVVLALVKEVSSPYQNREYARQINGWFVKALLELGVSNINHRGISDLVIDDRKILGASIFRRRLILFYQASLLVNNDLALFPRYLTFPDTVPDYRSGRSHEEFCTNLKTCGHELSVGEIMERLQHVVRGELFLL
jgi:lipoate-protein ligase A